MALAETGKTFPYVPWMREEDLPPRIPFPKKGLSQEKVMKLVERNLTMDARPEKNFLNFAATGCHPFSKKIFMKTLHSNQSGFNKDLWPGTYKVACECVRMIGSLFHAPPQHGGFLTPGGTESNLYGVRLARNLARKSKPELVMPETAHFSFHLGGELFGVRVKTADVTPELTPKMDEVESLITKNTVMLVCTAPEPQLGNIDPVEQFSELAEKHGLFLHVDSCVGGFLLPFMRELGRDVPRFDFEVSHVNSISADAHKLGMQMKPTSSFIFRDRKYLDSIPVEQTLVPVMSGSSRLGASAYSLWALIHHLGMDGYKRYVKNALDLTSLLTEEVDRIDGLRVVARPATTIVGIASDKYDVSKIEKKLKSKGWVTPVGTLPHTDRGYIRVFIHPLKTKTIVENYIEDLKVATKKVRDGQ